MAIKRTLFTLACALAMTGPALAQSQGVSKTEITVATIQDLSGPLAGFGKQARNGMQLRVDEINEQNGITPPAGESFPLKRFPDSTETSTAVFAQADLPEAVRAQLPSLKISGVTYSSNPVYRMAIVNGQVLHEGDPAGPGLLLEKIEPGRTIWSFKGYRYGLASQ